MLMVVVAVVAVVSVALRVGEAIRKQLFRS